MTFRKFITSSGKQVLGGKTAENNEELVSQADKDEIVIHTAMPGSPFVNIKGKATGKDIKEAAVFCAAYSRDWKKNGDDVEVHIFKGRDIFKETGMKTGTFGVRKVKKIIIKKEEILKFEEVKNKS